jgi:hypothetical protein
MATEENSPEGHPNAPKPGEHQKQNTEERRIYSDINKSHDPDWSKMPPLQEGYRPNEDNTNPKPPTDSASSSNEE